MAETDTCGGQSLSSKTTTVPRSHRDQGPGFFHIGVSAAGSANYFRDDVDHVTWTRDFVRVLDRYGWSCTALCQMSTHWHALVEVPDESLSAGMHFLNCRYSRRFNARHDRVGYLVRDRFWSRRKPDESALLEAYRYVVSNPVEAGAVSRPEDWFWSSYATTLGLADTFPFVDAAIVLAAFSQVQTTALTALRRFVDGV